VTLISNNSSSAHNQPASFRTYLPYTLQLEGQWECSLAELSFMKSWNNIDNIPDEKPNMKQTTFSIFIGMDAGIYQFGPPSHDIEISSGYYSSIDDLLINFKLNYDMWAENLEAKIDAEIEKEEKGLLLADHYSGDERALYIQQRNDELERMRGYKAKKIMDGLIIGYDNIRKRVVLTFNPSVIAAFKFSRHLGYMLGFKEPEGEAYETQWREGIFVADYPINFNAGANSLYVYTDIIQPNIVSDKIPLLLKILNWTGDYGTYISRAYTKPYYLPVSCNTVNSIEVEIKDEMDRKIRFSFGITIVLLHFQKKKSFPLL
jgi:hypothetical protein